jgi:hypothetical protein
MKTRQFTLILLILLFSQQLFAAVWPMPNAGAGCVYYNQSDCILKTPQHTGHTMPMMQSVDVVDLTEKSSMICDHCSTTCQPSLVSDNLLPLATSSHLPFEAQSIDATVDTFLSTLYRPPILA